MKIYSLKSILEGPFEVQVRRSVFSILGPIRCFSLSMSGRILCSVVFEKWSFEVQLFEV
jgi:hypothetical protein